MDAVKTARDMAPTGVTVFERGSQPVGVGPFKTGKPVQLWKSTTALGPYKYLGKDDSGNAALLPHAAVDSWGDPNIPHIHHFETWDDWRKTRPVSQVFDPKGNLIPRDWLFYPAEAAALADRTARDIGQTVLAVEATDYRGMPFEFQYPDGDDRRIWKLKLPNGQMWDLNDIWEQQTRGTIDGPTAGTNRGVDAPGKTIYDGARLFWQPANQDDGSTMGLETPIPCRDLAADEEVALGDTLFDMGQVVVRKKGQTAPVSSGVGLTAEEHGWLKDIHDYIKS